MLKKFRERKIHFMILAFLIGLFSGINLSFMASAKEPVHKYLDYFHKVYQIIRSEYVEVPNNREIFLGAIKGMIRSLNDPFSRFLDEKSFADLNEITTGKFVGVGIVITIRDGEVIVISPIDDSPAKKAGIKAGDIITRVNGISIKNKKLSGIVKMIKGLPQTKVKLYIKREGFDDELVFEIERAPIKIKSVEYSIIKDKNIGYIKIKSFGSGTAIDVAKALNNINKNNIDKIVLDLRYNPGGLLQAAIAVSDLFLKKGAIIVSTRGRKGSGRERIFRSENDPLYKGKMFVLVNRGSASASEILSGAIRDNKRGYLLGEKTFGKGSVQKKYDLEEKIGVAITIAKYYTPSGELIHKRGIKPDIVIHGYKMSKEDTINLKTIRSKKLLDHFAKKGMEYNDETKKRFMQFLLSKKLKLTERTANFILKNRINRYKKQVLYDLEFDKQLTTAIEKLVGSDKY